MWLFCVMKTFITVYFNLNVILPVVQELPSDSLNLKPCQYLICNATDLGLQLYLQFFCIYLNIDPFYFSDSNIYMSNADYNQSDVSINGNLPLINLGFWYGGDVFFPMTEQHFFKWHKIQIFFLGHEKSSSFLQIVPKFLVGKCRFKIFFSIKFGNRN